MKLWLTLLATLSTSTLLHAASAKIDLSTEKQMIRGFGTCSAWNGYIDSLSEAPILWSTEKGAGLSLHRLMIPPEGQFDKYELANAKIATSYGVTIWGTPWYSKYGKDVIHGNDTMDYDTLYEADMQKWADDLANLAISMKKAGTPLYTISPQNEADLGWTKFDSKAGALWVGKYLGPTLKQKVPDLKVMGTETCNWWGFSDYFNTFKNNSDAWNVTDIFATHMYGGQVKEYPAIQAAGKEFWQTEIYDTQTDFEDLGMASALRVAKLIHEALTVANMNAWHFWWIKPCHNCYNGALWGENPYLPAKRLWIMGNWSRFVRPGFHRIDAPTEPSAGVYLSAFRDSVQRKFVLVATNNNSTSVTQAFSINGAKAIQATAYITDATRNIAMQAPQTVQGSEYTIELAPQSVTTIVFELEAKTPTVSLYKDYSYKTLVGQLPIGNYTRHDLNENGIFGDDISSMKVPEGITVELYDDDQFQTLLGTFTAENIEKLGDLGINDAVSSLRIVAASVPSLSPKHHNPTNIRWFAGHFEVANPRITHLQITDASGKNHVIQVWNGKAFAPQLSPGFYSVQALANATVRLGTPFTIRIQP